MLSPQRTHIAAPVIVVAAAIALAAAQDDGVTTLLRSAPVGEMAMCAAAFQAFRPVQESGSGETWPPPDTRAMLADGWVAANLSEDQHTDAVRDTMALAAYCLSSDADFGIDHWDIAKIQAWLPSAPAEDRPRVGPRAPHAIRHPVTLEASLGGQQSTWHGYLLRSSSELALALTTGEAADPGEAAASLGRALVRWPEGMEATGTIRRSEVAEGVLWEHLAPEPEAGRPYWQVTQQWPYHVRCWSDGVSLLLVIRARPYYEPNAAVVTPARDFVPDPPEPDTWQWPGPAQTVQATLPNEPPQWPLRPFEGQRLADTVLRALAQLPPADAHPSRTDLEEPTAAHGLVDAASFLGLTPNPDPGHAGSAVESPQFLLGWAPGSPLHRTTAIGWDTGILVRATRTDKHRYLTAAGTGVAPVLKWVLPGPNHAREAAAVRLPLVLGSVGRTLAVVSWLPGEDLGHGWWRFTPDPDHRIGWEGETRVGDTDWGNSRIYVHPSILHIVFDLPEEDEG